MFKKKSFTVIELLVVIAIIGLLASVIIVGLNNVMDKAKISRAKAEMRQIMNAAEWIYNEYGYYPNDSHGSITCPRDIIIAPGVTWGKFIDVCNDPYGNPYEWNNTCAENGVRKADGSNLNCPPFSIINNGPAGVTMVGRNSSNDGCSGDDICYGIDGHSMYGWTSRYG